MSKEDDKRAANWIAAGALLSSMGAAFGDPNTPIGRLGQSAVQMNQQTAAAEQQSLMVDEMKRAAKKSKNPLGSIGGLLGAGTGALLAAPTGGLSVLAGANLGASLGGSAGSLLGGGGGYAMPAMASMPSYSKALPADTYTPTMYPGTNPGEPGIPNAGAPQYPIMNLPSTLTPEMTAWLLQRYGGTS